MNPSQSPEVAQAMARRQMGQPIPQLQQISPDAAMQSPMSQPMNTSDMTGSSTPPSGSSAPSQKFSPQNQEDMIVMALIEQLKNSGKIKKEQMKFGSNQPSQPQTPIAPAGQNFMQSPSMATSQMQSQSPFGGSF